MSSLSIIASCERYDAIDERLLIAANKRKRKTANEMQTIDAAIVNLGFMLTAYKIVNTIAATAESAQTKANTPSTPEKTATQ